MPIAHRSLHRSSATCRRRLTTALVLVLGLATACGDGPQDATIAQPSTSPSATPAATATPPLSVPSATPTTASPTFSIRYSGGKVSGDTGRLKVKLGSRVTIEVSSDVADEVHLHGYDVSRAVPAGGEALLAFTASIPGVFELELEELGAELAKVQVQ